MTRVRGLAELRRRVDGIHDRTRRNIYRALRKGAQAIADDAAQRIIDPPKTGRVYRSRSRKGALHQASAPGESPAADTGQLDQSLTARGDEAGLTAEAATATPYAVPLELGTSKIAPRPFMRPAFQAKRDGIVADVVEGARDALRGN